jgi:hypothetical protein
MLQKAPVTVLVILLPNLNYCAAKVFLGEKFPNNEFLLNRTHYNEHKPPD